MNNFDNINTKSLLNAINNALNELDNYNLKNIKSSLKSNETFDSIVKDKVIDGIDEIISSSKNGSISTLKKNLKKLKDAIENMDKYQNLKSQIIKLEGRRFETVNDTESYTNSFGETSYRTVTKKVENESVANQIHFLEKAIDNLEDKIDEDLS